MHPSAITCSINRRSKRARIQNTCTQHVTVCICHTVCRSVMSQSSTNRTCIFTCCCTHRQRLSGLGQTDAFNLAPSVVMLKRHGSMPHSPQLVPHLLLLQRLEQPASALKHTCRPFHRSTQGTLASSAASMAAIAYILVRALVRSIS